MRLATLLLGGKTAAAEAVVQASFTALQHVRNRLSDPGKARVWLLRAMVNYRGSCSATGPSVTVTRHSLRLMRQAPGMRPLANWTGRPGS